MKAKAARADPAMIPVVSTSRTGLRRWPMAVLTAHLPGG